MKFHSILIPVYFLLTAILLVPVGSHALTAFNTVILSGTSYNDPSIPATLGFENIILLPTPCTELKASSSGILEEPEEEHVTFANLAQYKRFSNVPLKIMAKPQDVLHLIGSIIAPTTDFSP